METIKIQTTQNVDIEYTVASVGERIISMFLDYTFMLVYILVLRIFIPITFNIDDANALLILLMIPVFFYSLILESFFNGQSFGKMIFKLKVVKADGAQPSFGNYLLRWIFRIIEGIGAFFGVVAIITIIINGKGQRLGDIAGGTTVIRLKKDIKLEDTIFAIVPEDYQLVYNEVRKLSEKDINTINEVIQHYIFNPGSEPTLNLLYKTRTAIEKKMGITSKDSSLKFLQTLIKDYNYVNIRT